MTTWALLAPGPSATVQQADAVHAAGLPLGAVGNAFQLALQAAFIAASDAAWWRSYPQAKRDCPLYCMATVPDVERVRIPGMASAVNSGVLSLEVAKLHGATTILLLGFDMHGSHYFGKYANGLRNTTPGQRLQHHKQYAYWARSNPRIRVLNCTEGSALECFPRARLDDCLHDGFRAD